MPTIDSKQDDELRKQIYKEIYGIYQSPEVPERTKQVDNVLEIISTHYIPKAEVLGAINSMHEYSLTDIELLEHQTNTEHPFTSQRTYAIK